MSDYVDLIRQGPCPSDAQITRFARHVAGDHSWYKKLPMLGRGEPFFLYLDTHPHAVLVDRLDGTKAWRPIGRQRRENAVLDSFVVQRGPGDAPGKDMALQYYARGKTTDEYRASLGHWLYWNWGRPDQPESEALAHAASSLRVHRSDGSAIEIPQDILELGLVYLRATVSGYMGPTEAEYEAIRAEHELPTAEQDCLTQIAEMTAAMRNVRGAIFG